MMANYDNSDPNLTDDIDESIAGIKDTADKAKRAKDIIQKGRDAIGGRSHGQPRQGGVEQNTPRTNDMGKQSGPQSGPQGKPYNNDGRSFANNKPSSGGGASSTSMPSRASTGIGGGASAGGGFGTSTASGIGTGGGATAVGGGTAAAGGGAAAAGSGGAAAAAGGGAAGGWIVLVVILLVIFCSVIFMPNAAGGNQITHYNDGEVLGTQGPNEAGEYSLEDLEYDRQASEEKRVFLQEAVKNQRELVSTFKSALDAAVADGTAAANELGADKIVWEFDGFSKDNYLEDHIFKDTAHANPNLLYVLCAYSIATNNFLGEKETVEFGKQEAEDEDGNVQSFLELFQRNPSDSIFNQGLGSVELIKKTFGEVRGANGGKGLASVPNPYYDYGNIVHGVTIGEPYTEIVTVEPDPDDEDGEETTKEITCVPVTVHDIDVISLCETAFGFTSSDIYEKAEVDNDVMQMTVTIGETIDDMVTYAGRLILEASGEDPESIMFSYGSSSSGFISPSLNMTGNGSQDMVNAALAHLGNVGGAEFKEWYGLSYNSAWCAAFVSYVANECGYIDDGIIPKFCSCTDGRSWFIQQGKYKLASSGYVPNPGDIVFFSKTKGGSKLSHVGIVISADDANTVYTIEGNTSNPTNASATYGVYKKTRSPNSGPTYIVGYGIPSYPSSGGVDGFQSPVGPDWRSKVTSEFGPRVDPITKKVNAGHNGMDIAVPTGTSIHAALPGTVIIAKYGGSYGNYVKIDHGNGLQTLYAHNSQLLVTKGQTVQGGDIIAKSGSTGRSTGPHCHFEVWLNGKRTQPRDYLP